VAVIDPTSNGATDMGCHSSFSPSFPSPALRRVNYPFTAGLLQNPRAKLCFELGPLAPVVSTLTTQQRLMLTSLSPIVYKTQFVHRITTNTDSMRALFLPSQ